MALPYLKFLVNHLGEGPFPLPTSSLLKGSLWCNNLAKRIAREEPKSFEQDKEQQLLGKKRGWVC